MLNQDNVNQQQKSPVEEMSDGVSALGSKEHSTLGTSVLYTSANHAFDKPVNCHEKRRQVKENPRTGVYAQMALSHWYYQVSLKDPTNSFDFSLLEGRAR